MGTVIRLLRPPLLLLLFFPEKTSAQNTRLNVLAGTTLTVTANNLVLNNTDFQCDGIFDGSNAELLVTGSNNTTFSGAGTPLIKVLNLNTSAATTLTLQNTIQISNVLNFQNGLIDLNNHQVQLISGAVLQSESEASRIEGPLGGSVTASAAGVNNPVLLNIGNLGAALTTGANLGNLTVSRSGKPATNPGNSSLHGIQRTYLIQPQNNTALNATLRFYYLNAELGGDDPNTLSLWKSADGITWTQVGFDTRNTIGKYVEKTGIADLSYWTLSDLVNPLPLTLLSFRVICQNGYAVIQWQTGTEVSMDHFEMETSADGNTWIELSKIAAADDPNGSSYSFRDQHSQINSLYRLKMVDRSGSFSYSPVFRGGCSDITIPFMVYPNPSPGNAVAQLSVREASPAIIQVWNTSGQLLYSGQWNLQPGMNQIVLPVSGLAAGFYVVKLLLHDTVLETGLIRQ